MSPGAGLSSDNVTGLTVHSVLLSLRVTGAELVTDRPRAGVHCLMTRITLRSGAPVRNPLPSLYSGLCCTPVHHAWGPPVRVPWWRFHKLKVCRDHIWLEGTTPGSSNYGAQALPMLFVSLQAVLDPWTQLTILTSDISARMNAAPAGPGCAGVTGVCHVKCHYCHNVTQCHDTKIFNWNFNVTSYRK